MQALLAQFVDRKLKDPVLRRISDLVEIKVDASLPRGVSCRMTMIMKDGRKFVSQVDYPKGSIQNPMTDDELRAKFESLAQPVLGAGRATRIADLVNSIEKCADVAELMRLTAKPDSKPKRKAAARKK